MRRQTTIISTTQFEGFDPAEIFSMLMREKKTGSITVHLTQGTPTVVEWTEKKSVLEGTGMKKSLDNEVLAASPSSP